MFVWTIPDELCTFVNRQFVRFQAPFPSEKVLNEVGEFVIDYVAINNYFPSSVYDAQVRYANPSAGLSEPERFALIAPLEYKIKVKLLEKVTFEQLHLAAWSALMWCWTEKGVGHVNYRKETIQKDASVYSNNQESGYQPSLYQMV